MGNSEKSKFSESQLYQMRCQVIAYKLLAMQEPVPKGLMEAAQGKNNQQQQQRENTAGKPQQQPKPKQLMAAIQRTSKQQHQQQQQGKNTAPLQQHPKQGTRFKFILENK